MSNAPNVKYNTDNDFYYFLAVLDDESVKTTLLHFNLTEIINMSNQIKKINLMSSKKEEIVEFLPAHSMKNVQRIQQRFKNRATVSNHRQCNQHRKEKFYQYSFKES